MKTVWWCAAMVVGVLACGEGDARGTLPEGAVLVSADQSLTAHAAPSALAAASLDALRHSGPEAALLRLRGETDVLRFETAAAQVIEALQHRPPSAAARQLLQGLSDVPTRVFARHDESAAEWYLPVFDIAARARAALAVLDRVERVTGWAALLEVEPGKALNQAARSDADADAVALALARLSPEALQRVQAAALADPETPSSRTWATLAQLTLAPNVLEQALARGRPVDVLPLFAEVATRGDAGLALDWLQGAAKRRDYASVAVMGLGRLAVRSPAAEAALWSHLAEADTGASAAAALATLPHAERVARLVARLAKVRNPTEARHLVLALRLDGSEQARHALREAAESPGLDADLRKELSR